MVQMGGGESTIHPSIMKKVWVVADHEKAVAKVMHCLRENKKKGGGRNRNYDQGKPATIYQIGATTELSTNDEHRLEFVKE